jgi:hypothetical protein
MQHEQVTPTGLADLSAAIAHQHYGCLAVRAVT